jgi:UDP-4-amino-4,6-dideoxy-N-acetyl-beta-L-altrosamine transaminase
LTRTLPYGRQSIDDEDVAAVVECLRSDFLTQGPRVELFESALCEHTGAAHAVAVASGTAALHVAVLAMGLGPGDVGIVPAITFVATANALRYAGAEVVFADVDPRTALIDVADLERRIDELARAGRRLALVAPVHMTGQPADLAAVCELAARAGARVLEDAAHALGATYRADGRVHRVGGCAHSLAATLSFHPVKHVTTAEGGAIVTQDGALAARARELRTHGIHRDPARLERVADDAYAGSWYYEQSALGFNYRLPDLLCALGIAQLRRLPSFLARRRAIAARYRARCAEPPLAGVVEPVPELEGRSSAYHLFVVRVLPRDGESPRDVALRRKALYATLREAKVLAQVHYVPVPWQPFHGRAGPEDFPGATAWYASCLSLPMYPGLADDDVDRVVDCLRRWAERAARS